MGEFDFTYELPGNFQRRVVQYLQQTGSAKVAEAFLRCRYEYDVLGFAYYEGIRGDNWNKKAVDFTIEGKRGDIAIEEITKKRLLMIASSINRRRLLITLHIHPHSHLILHLRIELIPQPIP